MRAHEKLACRTHTHKYVSSSFLLAAYAFAHAYILLLIPNTRLLPFP